MRLALLAPLLWSLGAAAQPASFRAPGPPASVDVLTLPRLDNDALARRADAARRAGPAPLRFAEPVAVALDTGARGAWTTLDDGTRVWRLGVASPGALSLSFGFSRFRLPEGASLWVYPEGGAPEIRPFTEADNEDHGQLWTPIVPGDRAVLELNLPPTKRGGAPAFDLELARVHHAFRPALLTAAERARLGAEARRSGSCNVDVVCPQGDDYRDIIQSVGAYTVGGTDTCTGAAINTTAGDHRPLFLTAHHCEVTEANAASVVVYWNYQNSTCRAPGSSASGGPGDGPRDQFNTGTRALGRGEASDWSVLEFDDPILPEAAVFLAGWDRRDLAPASAVAIHHPGVEEKRISFEDQPTSITTYGSDASDAQGTHIRVADWDVGTTEGGSSGSPLFNADRRIVGQLHGGGAACENDLPDWYGRLHASMADGLAAILDPGGTGAETVDGAAYVPTVTTSAVASVERARVGDEVTFTFRALNPTPAALAGVTFANTLPEGLALTGGVSASIGAASVAGSEVGWTGVLGAGLTLTLSYTAVVEAGAPAGALANTATFDFGAAGRRTETAEVVVVQARPAPDLVVDAAPAVSIPDAGCPSFTESTLDVAEGFGVGRVSVGVGVEHTWRGDLRVRLTSPAGTTVDLINRLGGGILGSGAANLNVLIDDAGEEGAFAEGDHDLSDPYDAVEGAPEGGDAVGALAAFVGESAGGTWTLGVCDGAEQDVGTLQSWQLLLVRSGPVAAEAGPASERGLSVSVVGANPSRSATEVEVAVAAPGEVRVDLLDIAGRTVRTLYAGPVAGARRVPVAVDGLAAGLYVVRAIGPEAVETAPLSVVR